MAVLLIIWLACAFIGLLIGSNKGRPGAGFLLGLFLGFIGLIIIAVMSPTPEAQALRDQRVAAASQALTGPAPTTRTCPWCAEQIQLQARVCKHCGRDVQPLGGALAPAPPGTGEGWMPDPSGRHPDRWWDGSEWTQWVRDKPGGTRSEDPPLANAAS
jgi:hypothetical protein